MKYGICEEHIDVSEDSSDLEYTSFYGEHGYKQWLDRRRKLSKQDSANPVIINVNSVDSHASNSSTNSTDPSPADDTDSRKSLFWGKPVAGEVSIKASSEQDAAGAQMQSVVPVTHMKKPSAPSTSDEDCVEISREILFTYTSRFVDSSVDITKFDRERVARHYMLNDSVINFYLSYLFTEHMYDALALKNISKEDVERAFEDEKSRDAKRIRQCIDEEKERFYIFSTFFYPLLMKFYRLKDDKTGKKVRKWAEKGHVFDRDFVLFPIFDKSHFSLALLCYPNKLIEYIKNCRVVNGISYLLKNEKAEGYTESIDKLPCILILDSLFTSTSAECNIIRYFLSFFLHDRYNIPFEVVPSVLPQITPSMSNQSNGVDCGVYLLGFADAILKNIQNVDLKGDYKSIMSRADQLFHWLMLPKDAIDSLRDTVCNVMHDLSRKRGVDLFAAESSGDSDVEEINARSLSSTPQRSDNNEQLKITEKSPVHRAPKSDILEKELTPPSKIVNSQCKRKHVSLFSLRPAASQQQQQQKEKEGV